MSTLKTHCKRGHELNEKNTYLYKGLRSCRVCRNKATKESEAKNPNIKQLRNKYRNNWTEKNPEYFKNHWLMRAYEMPREEFDQKLKEQGNKCAICGRLMDKPCVDHDHDTEENRGLLCLACNSGLGHFQDNFLVLEAAATYLRKYKEE